MKRIILIILSIVLFSSGTFLYFNSSPSLMQDEIFTVKNGETLQGAALRLKKNNLIMNETFFKILSYLYLRKHIKAGRYKVFSDMTSIEIFNKLARGQILTRKVTIPEGFNIYQISDRLDNKGITDSGKFLYYSFNREFLRSIGILSPSAEGYLFPDTYILPENSDARDIIITLHNSMKKIFRYFNLSEQKQINLDKHKILILASLIEKEARLPSERIYISSVFHNRIRRKMRLDCDPTVRYALKKFTRRLTFRDLAYDSPYNTYKRRGLPPTPICSPGKASIIAVLKPARTDYLYFVSRNDGSHYFSRTLREHNRAVQFYQRGNKNGFIDRQKL